MNAADQTDRELEARLAAKLLDVLIRFAMVLVLAFLCYQVFSPFLSLMVWAVILAVTLYPAFRKLARRMGERQGLAATVMVLGGLVLIVAPTTLLVGSLGDSVHDLVAHMRDNTLHVPPPSAGVAEWPIVGKKVFAAWSQAHEDLPRFIQSQQPKVADLSKKALAMVASLGGMTLAFLASFIIAGIIMAFGESGARASIAIFRRIVGDERGETSAKLSTATIRAVALGVVGIAFVQAIVIGLVLILAGVPFAGVLAMIALVLGIVQVPALIVTLPVIVFVWSSGDYATGPAVLYSVLLVVAGMMDNVLKPLMLGRGVDAPMPVILLGALGGLATSGILGMFIGATLLAIGYQLFSAWVADRPHALPVGEPLPLAEDAP
jgi:predicted PurR-regulated permease PerM